MRLEEQEQSKNTKQTSDNGNRLIDLCEQKNLIIASTFKRNHRRHHLTHQGTTSLPLKERKKLNYIVITNVPLEDIRRSRAVWDTAFHSDHSPFLLSIMARFKKWNRVAQNSPKLDLAGLKNEKCRKKFR
ncbi:hypothetical protein RB195_017613 [Necator americanus]|uniref:Endonuclease/exonuclease/phosphatase domain-containing protein n=1 Tax=Necator americanus TaxID=51031 RepID=A0ABR1C601_NECAM